jgi:integrase
MSFAAQGIRSFQPRASPYEIPETGNPGFVLRVHPTARKVWVYRYRINGRLRRLTLGVYREDRRGVSLAEARRRYFAARTLRESGADPEDVRDREIEAKREATDRDSKRWSVAALIEHHIEESRAGTDKKRSWAADAANLRRDIPVAWLERSADSITRAEVRELHAKVAKRAPRVAALVIAALRKAFNRGIEAGVLESNPCDRLRTTQAGSRERYLSDTELRAFMANVGAVLSADHADVAMLCLWTAARRNEVIGLLWAELDPELGVWRLPGARTKNAKPHEIPLPRQAVALLRERRRRQKGARVFPSPRDASQSISPHNFSHAIRRAAPMLGLEPFTPHDLRRTVATHLTRDEQCHRVVLERILNHTDRSVTARYDRHSYDKESRRVLQRWADRLDEFVGDP